MNPSIAAYNKDIHVVCHDGITSPASASQFNHTTRFVNFVNPVIPCSSAEDLDLFLVHAELPLTDARIHATQNKLPTGVSVMSAAVTQHLLTPHIWI